MTARRGCVRVDVFDEAPDFRCAVHADADVDRETYAAALGMVFEATAEELLRLVRTAEPVSGDPCPPVLRAHAVRRMLAQLHAAIDSVNEASTLRR